ncbi:hypothetical protein SLE2022_246380 [Rubroshorea leprosula]
MPFFVDFVSICCAVRFTLLDFFFHALAFLKARKLPEGEHFLSQCTSSTSQLPPGFRSLPVWGALVLSDLLLKTS